MYANPVEIPTLADIEGAAERIRGGVVRTGCHFSSALSDATGCRVWVKPEYRQTTGSFKERGARNALLRLPPSTKGVIAASAGNHALALAWHGRDLGIPVTVVMPRFAPMAKQGRCRAYGARVLLHGDDIQEAKTLADELVASEGLTYIHGFDGFDVIAGQGTIGLEIAQDLPDADAVIVPVGGAGLIAGVGLAVKSKMPECRVIGVEPSHAASFREALASGGPVSTCVKPTLADGLAVPTVGPRAFALAKQVVDEMTIVDEEKIAQAILRLVELERGVVEGGGASALAALLGGGLPHLRGKKVVLILCGGNIDPTVLGRVIEHALVADGRLTRFQVVISDRPGGLAKLTDTLANAGASIKQIVHERAFASADVSTVEVDCVVETRDHEHARSVIRALTDAGFSCRRLAKFAINEV